MAPLEVSARVFYCTRKLLRGACVQVPTPTNGILGTGTSRREHRPHRHAIMLMQRAGRAAWTAAARLAGAGRRMAPRYRRGRPDPGHRGASGGIRNRQMRACCASAGTELREAVAQLGDRPDDLVARDHQRRAKS